MHLTIVHHAGTSDAGSDTDMERSLDKVGERQAGRLAALVMTDPVRRLVASPAPRCVGTLQPLAIRLGLTIEPCHGLDPAGDPADITAMFTDVAYHDAVLCTQVS